MVLGDGSQAVPCCHFRCTSGAIQPRGEPGLTLARPVVVVVAAAAAAVDNGNHAADGAGVLMRA